MEAWRRVEKPRRMRPDAIAPQMSLITVQKQCVVGKYIPRFRTMNAAKTNKEQCFRAKVFVGFRVYMRSIWALRAEFGRMPVAHRFAYFYPSGHDSLSGFKVPAQSWF